MASAVSVIIPVYNGQAFVGETLRSVLAQSIDDLEVVVVDDGCTDGSRGIVESVGDARVRIHSQANAGLSVARNVGIREATRPYVAFLDADDLWCPNKLHWQLEALNRHPQCQAAYSAYTCIDASTTMADILAHGDDAAERRTEATDLSQKLLFGNCIGNGSSMLMRRDLTDRIGFFDESLCSAADWDYYARIARVTPFAAVLHADVFYRIHSGSMSHQLDRVERDCLAVLNRMLSNNPERFQPHINEARACVYDYLLHQLIRCGVSVQAIYRGLGYCWQAEVHRPGGPLAWPRRVRWFLRSLLSQRLNR